MFGVHSLKTKCCKDAYTLNLINLQKKPTFSLRILGFPLLYSQVVVPKIFTDEEIKERMRQIVDGEKHPLPPDGLWVGADRNSDPVDGWEWDLNDSLS